jgi:DNA-binding protein HU-beta
VANLGDVSLAKKSLLRYAWRNLTFEAEIMNKAMLALKLAEKMDVPKKTAEDFIATFQEIVTTTLANDEEVTIAGFGTFSSRIRAARKGVNPRNPSQVIDVPAVKVPKFKAGKALKDTLKASTPGKLAPKQEQAPDRPAAPEPTSVPPTDAVAPATPTATPQS